MNYIGEWLREPDNEVVNKMFKYRKDLSEEDN